MKIVVTGNYGAHNLGDEMILQGLIKSIRNVNPKAEISVLSGNPKETARAYSLHSAHHFPSGIRSFLKYIFDKRAKKLVKECDYFILGGGGLFGSILFRANIIWAIQALKAYRLKKPVIMYGQNVGEIKNPFLQKIIKKIFSKAILIVVRDEKSKRRLISLGVKKKIHILPDLAFRTKGKALKRKKKTIIVALRQMDGLKLTFKKTIASFLKNHELKYQIKFVEFQKGVHSDRFLHSEIAKDLKKPKFIKYKNTAKVLKEFAEAEVILGMRLHSIITAIKTCTPFVAINYASKIKDFLTYAKFHDYLVDMDNVSEENLSYIFYRAIKDKKKLIRKFKSFCDNALKQHKKFERTTLHKLFSNGR